MADKENIVGIIGHTGNSGKEIVKILSKYDLVQIGFTKNSTSEEGKIEDCDLVFLATNAEQSLKFASEILTRGKKVIDLSAAFRLPKDIFELWYRINHTSPDLISKAVYGLPAIYENEIKTADLVANPGCFATCVILALRPIAKYISDKVSINATSGISGAGKDMQEKPNEITYSFGREHRHVPEMERYSNIAIRNFSPIRIDSVYRGINANIEAKLIDKIEEQIDAKMKKKDAEINCAAKEIAIANFLRDKIQNAYKKEDQVFVACDTAEKTWGTSDVKNTHMAMIKLNVKDGFVYITSMIDNLGKGAASQAVENMNIMLGFDRLYRINETYRIL